MCCFIQFLRHLPDFKQRIAGQTLPFEDFAIHKANKYFEQNGRLFLPGVVSDCACTMIMNMIMNPPLCSHLSIKIIKVNK